ncbi:hypothetical protein T484DRAFT_1922296 [Baffinella frigidus]|nr:hypothetical protein T484DRAFT_1922296 [Cryptophyta sp. CCMP2293]
MGAKHGVAAAVLCAACVLFAATQIPQPTALEGWRSQEQGLWRAPVVSQAQQELSRVRAEIRADRVLNARVARPIAPPAALRFHQLPQTGREMGMKVFAGNMLCGVGETSCEHPCEAFHTITETESDCKCKCTANPHAFYKDDAVICTCPDAPNYATDEARDMYPYAEGERPEPPAVQEEEAPAAEVEEAGADAEEAGADAAPLPPAEEEEGAGGEAGVDAEGAEVAAEPEVQEREAAPEAVRARPGGLMAKAQQLALPKGSPTAANWGPDLCFTSM